LFEVVPVAREIAREETLRQGFEPGPVDESPPD
jgi:hypothetical protein